MPCLVKVLLIVIALLAVATGVTYLVEPVHSLPSFFPGYVANGHGTHNTRGYVAIGVGVLLLIIAAIPGTRRREY